MEDFRSITERIEERMAKYLIPDIDGNITLEYGDFPVYGDGRKDHKFVTRRDVVNVSNVTRAVLLDLPEYWPWYTCSEGAD